MVTYKTLKVTQGIVDPRNPLPLDDIEFDKVTKQQKKNIHTKNICEFHCIITYEWLKKFHISNPITGGNDSQESHIVTGNCVDPAAGRFPGPPLVP